MFASAVEPPPISGDPSLSGSDAVISADDLRQRFLSVAAEIALPVAEHLGATLALVESDSGCVRWIGDRSSRPGDQMIAEWPISCQNADLGTLQAWFPRRGGAENGEIGGRSGDSASVQAADVIRRMSVVAARQVEANCIEEDLLVEVCESHERLRAVYEISTQLFSIHDTDKLLDQILHRASSIQKGLRAVLWIERNGHLEPIQGFSDPVLGPRGVHEGLVGKALTDLRPLVSKRQLSGLEDNDDIDPELAQARSVMIAPVETRQGQRVALQLWSEEDEDPGVFGSPTMHLALSIALQAAMVVENERLHRESVENERLRQELEIGSRIQQTLLLSEPPRELSGASVSSLTISSRMVDGDFIEFFRHDNRCFDVVVGDVMGKGIPAALLGAGAKSELHRTMSQLLFVDNSRFPDPASIVQQCHSRFVKRLIDLESFITLCYARIDLRRQELIFVDCGHTATVHYSSARRRSTTLQGDNVPLGFSDKENYQQQSIPFREGDVFVFYSDGLTEARDANGEFFGENRLVQLVEQHRDANSRDLIKIIENTVIGFCKDGALNDDLTCVVVKIAPAVPVPVRHAFLEVTSQPKELSRIRKFIHEVCRCQMTKSWGDEHLYQLEVAVNEAATNIMEHAYLWKTDRWIRIDVNVTNDEIEISLTHDGKPFNPRDTEPPRFDGSRDGGFGLFIINNYVDEVLYTRDDSGANRIRLTKKRGESENGPGLNL